MRKVFYSVETLYQVSSFRNRWSLLYINLLISRSNFLTKSYQARNQLHHPQSIQKLFKKSTNSNRESIPSTRKHVHHHDPSITSSPHRKLPRLPFHALEYISLILRTTISHHLLGLLHSHHHLLLPKQDRQHFRRSTHTHTHLSRNHSHPSNRGTRSHSHIYRNASRPSYLEIRIDTEL